MSTEPLFDFLPNLPKANLDDRRYEELMAECLQRIPRYCPEWTNFNPSDPGITLVELFAWLTEQMLVRFNQVPRRYYIAFLEMLGMRLQAALPARTEVTFYLSASLPEPYLIPQYTTVATLRTENDEAIEFSTDRPLTVGLPRIRHLLTAPIAEDRPGLLRDCFASNWNPSPEGHWTGLETPIFAEQPEPENCFYLVFQEDQQIAGNVIAVKFRGEAATATGINPEHPPLRWEAWDGEQWRPVLYQREDDRTEGFSFSKITRDGGDPLQGAEVRLHFPTRWPVQQFASYQGHWLRCVYRKQQVSQAGYLRSPRIVGLGCRSVGGTVPASQCALIRHEILGESTGDPGQRFQLLGTSVLPRKEEEYILVTPLGGSPQRWREVQDFATSTGEDLHYVIDDRTGQVQFGPLVREPQQLAQQIQWRTRWTQGAAAIEDESDLERQYGAVPPRGARIEMVAYRTGGGQRGNVQPHTIRMVKTAVPYVASITNHLPGRNGTDAESLENLVLRVPQMLRTRDRAVTAEDFEYLAIQGGAGAIARAVCLTPQRRSEAGQVRLVLVPQATMDQELEGLYPDRLVLGPPLLEQIRHYLDERRLLGVEILYSGAEYVGVSVQAEVALEPAYQDPQARQQVQDQLIRGLYRFLNPLTGGPEGKGWPFGRPVYPSDVVNRFQSVPGVRYLGTVKFYELRRDRQNQWLRSAADTNQIDPGPLGLICSWRDDQLRSSHLISFL